MSTEEARDLSQDHVEAIARVAHEANRAYCATLGDHSQPPWDQAPEWQKASARQGVANIFFGAVLYPEQSHESWMAHKKAEGWVYGPLKDPEKKTHPCLVPFRDLPAGQQKKDHLFFAIVQALK